MTEGIIKKIHSILKANTSDSRLEWFNVGDYKQRPNMVGDSKTTTPGKVKKDMQRLLFEYNQKEIIVFEDIVEFHYRFEKIHPFQDGNGRTGRMLLFKECLRSHIMPFIIGDERKAEYYECLNNAQLKGDYEAFIRFFHEEQERYSEMVKDFICPVSKGKTVERKRDGEGQCAL